MAGPSGLLDQAQPDEAERGWRQDDRRDDDVHRASIHDNGWSASRLLAGHKGRVKEGPADAKKSSRTGRCWHGVPILGLMDVPRRLAVGGPWPPSATPSPWPAPP